MTGDVVSPDLWLSSDDLSVEVRPGKGADITSFVDRQSGIDVLFHASWDRPYLESAPTTGDSQVDWIARYGGGWQQLLPHAGAPGVVDGAERGYHGEAAVVAWTVLEATEARASMTVDLTSVPLRLIRTVRLDGTVLRVEDTVENLSDTHQSVTWVQHPGFGAPFVDEHCSLRAGARSFLADAEAPGTVLSADRTSSVPFAHTDTDADVDLRRVPGAEERRAMFGCLTGFEAGWFTIDSPSAGFGVRLDWDSGVFPHAWFWQECHASEGFPWHRAAYVIAVEPANVIPGDPSPGCSTRGQAPRLAPQDRWTSAITLTRTPLPS